MPASTAFSELLGTAPATHGHNTTDVVLDARTDGTIRAWSKFYIVRGDGTVGSGDYQDTLVRTADGWRIAERDVSRGNRLESDPTGGRVDAHLQLRQLARRLVDVISRHERLRRRRPG